MLWECVSFLISCCSVCNCVFIACVLLSKSAFVAFSSSTVSSRDMRFVIRDMYSAHRSSISLSECMAFIAFGLHSLQNQLISHCLRISRWAVSIFWHFAHAFSRHLSYFSNSPFCLQWPHLDDNLGLSLALVDSVFERSNVTLSSSQYAV